MITEDTAIEPYREMIATFKQLYSSEWWAKYREMMLADMSRDYSKQQSEGPVSVFYEDVERWLGRTINRLRGITLTRGQAKRLSEIALSRGRLPGPEGGP